MASSPQCGTPTLLNNGTAAKSIRFLVFPKGKSFLREFVPLDSIGAIKKRLVEQWPSEIMEAPENAPQIRLIFSGKELKDEEVLEDVLRLSNSNSPVTIHVVIRRKVSVPSLAPVATAPISSMNEQQQQNASNNPQQDSGFFDFGENIHFHGCCFDEEEANNIKLIFEKKKGSDEKMAFTDAHIFLRTYWKWMARNNYEGHDQAFPMDRLMQVKKKVAPNRDRITCSEFRQLFFLFDNHTSETGPCPHGSKSRVQQATEQLHKALQPNSNFAQDLFDKLWLQFNKQQDDTLSCAEMDLFYYLYSVELTELFPSVPAEKQQQPHQQQPELQQC